MPVKAVRMIKESVKVLVEAVRLLIGYETAC